MAVKVTGLPAAGALTATDLIELIQNVSTVPVSTKMTIAELFTTADVSITIGATRAFYFGDSDTNGSWRIIRVGNDLSVQRRESAVWTEKHLFTA